MEGPFGLFDGHEQVVYGADEASGLRCIIAIHSTALGPSLGGTRFLPYPSEQEALVDVLRLSRAMTYKAACAGLDLGGGKAVVIGDPATDRTEPLLRAYGRVVESLGGRYITACDVGTHPEDMEIVGRETRWATGKDEAHGGSGDSGVATARGVHIAMRTVCQRQWDNASLAGRHVAVQGLGKVGRALAALLATEGAKLTVSDIDEEAVDAVAGQHGADVVGPEDILSVDADILSPNALGGILNVRSIQDLQATVVCGGANNQLERLEDALRLQERGILYAPDYVVNAGGLINVADELEPGGYREERARARIERIGDNLFAVLELAEEQGVTTEMAAEQFAEGRIASVTRLRRFLLPARGNWWR